MRQSCARPPCIAATGCGSATPVPPVANGGSGGPDVGDGCDTRTTILAARIWTPPDLSRDPSPSVLRVGCSRISGLSVEELVLLAIMDSRAPRANRGAGVTRQGCYRPDAVSGRPKGHGFRHSLRTPWKGLLSVTPP